MIFDRRASCNSSRLRLLIDMNSRAMTMSVLANTTQTR
jgi:hypothetical protein